MLKRGVIVAKIKPGAEEEVAAVRRVRCDRAAGPRGVRHRSLWVLDDVYIHYVETDEDFAEAVDAVRDHPLFKEISARLDAYITPTTPKRGGRPRTPRRGSSTAGTPG